MMFLTALLYWVGSGVICWLIYVFVYHRGPSSLIEYWKFVEQKENEKLKKEGKPTDTSVDDICQVDNGKCLVYALLVLNIFVPIIFISFIIFRDQEYINKE